MRHRPARRLPASRRKSPTAVPASAGKRRRRPDRKNERQFDRKQGSSEVEARSVLLVRNRQRGQRVDLPRLREILISALDDELKVRQHEVGVHLVGAAEMTAVNETYLQHEGSTDVITFNHRDRVDPTVLHGELFVCVDEAVALAARFRSTWPAEVVRYAVHGFLHLQGHDDLEPAARRCMKRVENRVMRSLRNRFAVGRIDRRMRPAR